MMPWEAYEYANVTSIAEAFAYADTVTAGKFNLSILVSVYAVFFMASIRYGPKQAFATANFISFIASLAMWAGGFLDGVWVTTLMIMTAASVFLLLKD